MRNHLSLLSTADRASFIGPSFSDGFDGGGDEQPGVGHHVLIVDNNEFSRRLTRKRLERAGFRVTFAEHALHAGAVDCVVSNVELFYDLAPGECAESLPVVVCGAFDMDDDERARAEDFGAFRVVSANDVVDAVLDALWEMPQQR